MRDPLDCSLEARAEARGCPDPVPEPVPDQTPPGLRPGPDDRQGPFGVAGPAGPQDPPGDLGEPAALREALLARFERPEDVAALHRLGALLFELVNESGQWGPRRAGLPQASPTRLCLRAASVDLFHVARDLAALAADRFESALDAEDHRLAERAERWAASATTLAAAIGGALEEGSGSVF